MKNYKKYAAWALVTLVLSSWLSMAHANFWAWGKFEKRWHWFWNAKWCPMQELLWSEDSSEKRKQHKEEVRAVMWDDSLTSEQKAEKLNSLSSKMFEEQKQLLNSSEYFTEKVKE